MAFVQRMRGAIVGRGLRAARTAACAAMALSGACSTAPALDVTGYSAAVNDRFASGFPAAPVPNTSGSFVGAAYDWSGVGWSTTTHAASSYKGFALLSPRHFLTAQHYENGGLLTAGVAARTTTGDVVSQTRQGITNLGYGFVVTNVGVTAPDLALGTLTGPIAAPTAIARYGVLDLYTSSTSTDYARYDNLPVLAYGRGSTTTGSPRAAATTVVQAAAFNSDAIQTGMITLRTGAGSVQLVEGDSGSPLVAGWTNPNGGQELAVLGLNTGVSGSFNLMSFLAVPGAMANANTAMAASGYALRVVGNVSGTWAGGSGGPTARNDLSRGGNWSGGAVPTDLYVLFNGTAADRSLDVDAATNLRGLAFKATGTSGDGFTFSGTHTLTIGRGGVTNYDADRQTITAPVALGDHQYWDVGAGGVTAGAINTNGRLLEIAGSGTARITGAVSGTGGLALSGGRLELTGSSTYTGATWVHAGTLVVNGNAAASAGVTVGATATLAGSGAVAAIGGAGTVAPGNSPGILTAPSVSGSAGLDFAFEFTGTGSPAYGTGTASVNDLLRLTGTAPFTQSLAAANAIDVFFNVPSLTANTVFRGGFFTDRDSDFVGSIQNASFTYYLANPSGTTTHNGVQYNAYAGTYTFEVSTVAETAGFAGGTEAGYVTQFTVVPEPAAIVLVVTATGGLLVGRSLRRRRPPRS
jgi:autotransporter-associated beta strand protein